MLLTFQKAKLHTQFPVFTKIPKDQRRFREKKSKIISKILFLDPTPQEFTSIFEDPLDVFYPHFFDFFHGRANGQMTQFVKFPYKKGPQIKAYISGSTGRIELKIFLEAHKSTTIQVLYRQPFTYTRYFKNNFQTRTQIHYLLRSKTGTSNVRILPKILCKINIGPLKRKPRQVER